MATSDFWQRVSASVASPSEWVTDASAGHARSSQGKVKFWMFLDFVTVLVSAAIATVYERHTNPVVGARAFFNGTLFSRSFHLDPAGLLCGFATALVITSRRLNLYSPTRLTSFLHEQRLTVQVCFTSGLLLTGTLYLVRAEDIPRGIVMLSWLWSPFPSVCAASSIARSCTAGSSVDRIRATCSSSAPVPKPMRCAITSRASATSATHLKASSNFPAPRPR